MFRNKLLLMLLRFNVPLNIIIRFCGELLLPTSIGRTLDRNSALLYAINVVRTMLAEVALYIISDSGLACCISPVQQLLLTKIRRLDFVYSIEHNIRRTN